jgi:hypothetical protein
MALTEETVEDKIEIVGDFKHVQVRTATVIKRDGVEISRSFTAMSLHQMQTCQVRALRYKPSQLRYTQTPLKQPMLHI